MTVSTRVAIPSPTVEAEQVVSVDGLRKAYGATVAVADVSFSVARGEIFGLLGPNGAGKTTTVECMQGLRRADGGRIRVLGFDPVSQAGDLRRRIGCQLQESALPARIRVREALDLFASLARRRVDRRVLMEQWGLGEKERAAFSSLSGGSARGCSSRLRSLTTRRSCSSTR